MISKKKKITAALLAAAMAVGLSACGEKDTPKKEYTDADVITLSDTTAKLNGTDIEVFDYTWHCDPSVSHDEVKDAPAEYYTGTKPETQAAVYIDSELYYFPELPQDGFKNVKYDGENEWAYYYTDGEHNDFIFATLPNLGASFPSDMMHSEAEAAKNRVLHITKAGKYVFEGSWQGQIRIDLGDKDETFTDENSKVTVILNGADIDCTVAPGIVFYSAYECDNGWEDAEKHTSEVDLSSAGVNVIIADGTENSVSGKNIFRMLKTKYKDEESKDEIKVQKKLRKNDAAFYSYVSMNINGEEENTGKLTVTSGFEGIDSELHLAVNGGDITVNSQDDGMNVNEDNVSVIKFCGGKVTLNAAQGAEGDGVDSNGFIRIDGGTVSVNGVTAPDSALDSEDGIYYNSGMVIIDGETQSYTAGSVFNETGRTGGQPNGEAPQGFNRQPENFDIKEFKEKVAALDDDATFEDVMEIIGMGGQDMQKPDGQQFGGQQPPEMPDGEAPSMPNGAPPEKPAQ